MHAGIRHLVGRGAQLLLAGGLVGLGACTPASTQKPLDGAEPSSSIIDLGPTTAGPPTTPLPTAYRTIPMVTAAAPYWAPQGWSMERVNSYLELVDEALADLGAEHTIDANNGVATLTNGTQVDLTLLAARLTLLGTAQWPAAVDAYLASALSPDQAQQNITFDEAQSLLRVRVGTLASLGLGIDQGVVQPISDDLVLAVVLAQENATVFISAAQLSVWRKTPDQVITTAIQQTLSRSPMSTRDGPFTVVTEDPFASAWLLDPTVVMQRNEVNGFLIAIPSLDQFIAIDAGPKLTPSTVQALIEQVNDDFSNRNNPASADLYWWRNGKVVVLHQLSNGVTIPDDLQALINGPEGA